MIGKQDPPSCFFSDLVDMAKSGFTDIVSINSFQVSANIGCDWWGRVRHQPISISVYLHLKWTYLQKAGESDDVRDSVHYGHLCKSLEKLVRPTEAKFDGLHGLAAEVTNAAFDLAGDAVEKVRVVVEAPKLCLMADGVTLESTSSRSMEAHPPEICVSVKGLNLAAIIGVNPPERVSKQRIIVDISFFELKPAEFDYLSLITTLSKVCSFSSPDLHMLTNIHLGD